MAINMEDHRVENTIINLGQYILPLDTTRNLLVRIITIQKAPLTIPIITDRRHPLVATDSGVTSIQKNVSFHRFPCLCPAIQTSINSYFCLFYNLLKNSWIFVKRRILCLHAGYQKTRFSATKTILSGEITQQSSQCPTSVGAGNPAPEIHLRLTSIGTERVSWMGK